MDIIIKSLPNEKYLDLTKLKVLADDKINKTSACQAPDPPPIGLFLTQHQNKSLK